MTQSRKPTQHLMIWKDGNTSFSDYLQSWQALAEHIGVDDFQVSDLEKEAFRRAHHLTLGFFLPNSTPIYELDMVTLKDGRDAYIKCKGSSNFVAVDSSGQEHAVEYVSPATKMVNYYFDENSFRKLFSDAGY